MRSKKKTILKVIIISVIAVAFIIGAVYVFKNMKTKKTSAKFAEYAVQKSNISVLISGTGTVNSSYKQELSPQNAGTITKVYFKEGDKVKAGDLMFELDDSDLEEKIERTRLSINQAENSLQKSLQDIKSLSVTSPISGQATGISINEADNINKGAEICTVTDTTKLIFTVPFNKSQIKKFYIGQTTDVYLQDYMQIVKGKVSHINNFGKLTDGGGFVYEVEITVDNPGTIKDGIKASAKIADEMSMDSALTKYKSTRKIKAEVSGTVKSINVRENQWLNVGQSIITLENADLFEQVETAKMKLRDLEIELESQIRQKDNYKVYAIEDGTIVKQDTKVGDVVKAADVISTVADYGKMEFSVDVDELDIAKIEKGMNVSVTVDALSNKRFKGLVSNVASEGESENGVATYPVTITIENPENIKGGMNATADIFIQQKENILTLPIEAVQRMGNQSFVYVRKTSNDTTQEDKDKQQSSDNSDRRQQRMKQVIEELGIDVTAKQVKVGINNDASIEITEGLNEGDKVIVPVTIASAATTTQRQTQMVPGGMGAGNFMPNNSNNRTIRTGGGTGGNRR